MTITAGVVTTGSPDLGQRAAVVEEAAVYHEELRVGCALHNVVCGRVVVNDREDELVGLLVLGHNHSGRCGATGNGRAVRDGRLNRRSLIILRD
jgi:hypothetical protein